VERRIERETCPYTPCCTALPCADTATPLPHSEARPEPIEYCNEAMIRKLLSDLKLRRSMDKNVQEQIRRLELMIEFHKFMDNYMVVEYLEDAVRLLVAKYGPDSN
jgi:hypothetical protein